MNVPSKAGKASLEIDARRTALLAQQIAQAVSAMEARVSGLADGAPLATIREANVTTRALAAQICGLMLDLVAESERLLHSAEQAHASEREDG